MDRTSKIAFASLMLALSFIAFPRHAPASTGTTVTAQDQMKGDSQEEKHQDWSEIVMNEAMTATVHVL
jgi:hypothetical protein